MPDYVVAAIGLLMWAQGVMLGGILWARGPFWDGVRSFYRLGRR